MGVYDAALDTVAEGDPALLTLRRSCLIRCLKPSAAHTPPLPRTTMDHRGRGAMAL